MDFSWVKQLAEEANQMEIDKQDAERKRQEELRLVALATVPFTEKLYKLVQTFCEEFNKHCIFPEARVHISRFQKKTKGPDYSGGSADSLEESAYFTFGRKEWMYGIRGLNGLVEFVKFPVSEGSAGLAFKLDELGVDSTYRLDAKVESGSTNVIWNLREDPMDGPKLISLCQHYFSEFIKATNK